MDFAKLKHELEQQRDELVKEQEQMSIRFDELEKRVTALNDCINACLQLAPYSKPEASAGAQENLSDTEKPTRRKSHAKELVGAELSKSSQKTGTCPDCGDPCSPTARRCRKCHTKQDKRHVRFSAFDRPSDEQENAPTPIASAEPLTQSAPDEKEPESEPEVFRMKNYQSEREAEGRQASQRLKEFKHAVRPVASEIKKASCGVCAIRAGENGIKFLAKQPNCPEHGNVGETSGARLASSLEGVR